MNQNAHSGHIRSCSIRNEMFSKFRNSNIAVFSNENLALNSWNKLDHSHYEFQQFKIRCNLESIKFLLEEFVVLQSLPIERIEKYCLFYLIVMTEIAPSIYIRNKSFQFVKQLINSKELNLLRFYWGKIGNHRYEPITDKYSSRWERFVRIKDECFFNIDYPIWLLLFDRYLLTFKKFGWQETGRFKGGFHDGYYDRISITICNLLRLEQDYIGIPASPSYQLHVPKSTLDLLHPSSRKRFSYSDSHWVSIANMNYNPFDDSAGGLV